MAPTDSGDRALMESVATTHAVLAPVMTSSRRTAVYVALINDGPAVSVDRIAEVAECSTEAATRHLRALAEAGLATRSGSSWTATMQGRELAEILDSTEKRNRPE